MKTWQNWIKALALAFLGLGLASLICRLLLWPRRRRQVLPTGFEKIEFSGLQGGLVALISQTNFQRSVLILHGIYSDKSRHIKHAELYLNQGFNVVLLDLASHGESEGNRIGLGYLEAQDLPHIFACLRGMKSGLWGIHGISMGGAAALFGFAHIRPDFLVLETVFARMRSAIKNRLVERLGKWSLFLQRPLYLQIRLWLGRTVDELEPIAYAGKVSCPCLVLGGESDVRTPVAETYELYQALAGPAVCEIIASAQHDHLMEQMPDLYASKLCAFLSQHVPVQVGE